MHHQAACSLMGRRPSYLRPAPPHHTHPAMEAFDSRVLQGASGHGHARQRQAGSVTAGCRETALPNTAARQDTCRCSAVPSLHRAVAELATDASPTHAVAPVAWVLSLGASCSATLTYCQLHLDAGSCSQLHLCTSS
jgi:hypothetical protein